MQVEGNASKFVWKNQATMTVAYDLGSCIPIAWGFTHAQVAIASGSLNICITDEMNQNLTAKQKPLLKWHFKLGHMGFD